MHKAQRLRKTMKNGAHLVRRHWLVVALQGVDGFGVAQGTPPVPLVGVGLGQKFQLVRQVLVVIVPLGYGRLGTHPLPRQARLRWRGGRRGGWGSVDGGCWARGALCRLVPRDQGVKVILAHTVLIPVVALAFLCLRLGHLVTQERVLLCLYHSAYGRRCARQYRTPVVL